MILAVDIGNTNITMGFISGKEISFIERVSTKIDLTPVEYAIIIKTIIEMRGDGISKFEGIIISSVVPQLTSVLTEAVKKLFHLKPVIVGPGIKTGINILIDDPSSLGSSLLVCSVAALSEYCPPLIVIEMSTATTLCIVNKKRQYVGGVICAGVRTSLDALVESTSLLHQVKLEDPGGIIGKNTIDCMKSGIIYGAAASIDGVVERVEEEIGESCSIVATGIYASIVVPKCKKNIVIDDELMIKGLRMLYEKNYSR